MQMDTATIVEGAAEVALSIAGIAFPEILPFIAIAKEAVPALIAAKPYIAQAVAIGESAFSVIDKTPGLGNKVKALADFIPNDGLPAIQHLDRVTIAGAGIAVPGWTLEDTMLWMNRAGGSDPTQENSQTGSA